MALHDEFYSADGERSPMRVVLHLDNTGRFFGKEPTGPRLLTAVSSALFTPNASAAGAALAPPEARAGSWRSCSGA